METLAVLWDLSRGYRLRPWASPYLRWRIETYWGIPAEGLQAREFLAFSWEHRAELWRYVQWAARQRR